MSRLILVRHGNTFDAGETPRRIGARSDLPLSSSGRVQAGKLAAHFAATPFAAAVASPRSRTRETARAILRARKDSPALLIERFLTEIDYGPDENQTEDAVIARLGPEALKAWDQDAVPPPGWRVDPAALTSDWRDFARRVATLGDTNILCVTSNGIARFLPGALGLARAGLDIKLKTGAYCEIDLSAGGASILSWNQRPA
jgi:probable phosphoglycerate mutase